MEQSSQRGTVRFYPSILLKESCALAKKGEEEKKKPQWMMQTIGKGGTAWLSYSHVFVLDLIFEVGLWWITALATYFSIDCLINDSLYINQKISPICLIHRAGQNSTLLSSKSNLTLKSFSFRVCLSTPWIKKCLHTQVVCFLKLHSGASSFFGSRFLSRWFDNAYRINRNSSLNLLAFSFSFFSCWDEVIQQTAAALAATNLACVFGALFGAVRAVPPYIMLPLYRTVFVWTWISASPAGHLAKCFPFYLIISTNGEHWGGFTGVLIESSVGLRRE